MATFDQSYAETGRQSELDALRATPGAYEKAKAAWEAGGGSSPKPQSSFSQANTTGGGNTTGYNSLDKYLAETGRQSELDAIRATPGGYEKAQADFLAGRGNYASRSSSSSLSGMLGNQATIDLPKLYEDLYAGSGIKDLEAEYSKKEKEYIEAKALINDNPFLSEGSRVGREAKLERLFAERTANLQKDILTKKADIETKLNLQTKQFDINSQQAQLAFNQFNSLLQAGALDNASGETIAQITRSTGVPSDAIYSAIEANKKKNVTTDVIKNISDSGEVTVSVINAQTGEIISQTSLGKVDKATKETGGGGGSDTKSIKAQFVNRANTIQGKQTSSGWIGGFPLLVAEYAPYFTLEEIYTMYANTEAGKQNGPPTERAKDIKEVYDTYRGN